jgi:hypothetical protein
MLSPSERHVLEYLLTFGFLNTKTEAVVNRVLRNELLSPGDANLFLREVVGEWFEMDCKACGSVIPLDDIPFVVESGDGLCRKCVGDGVARVSIE